MFIPICSSQGRSLDPNLEVNKKLIAQYQKKHFFDGKYLQYATGIIKNEQGQIYIAYNQKHQSWQIPSGKIDTGERIKEGFVREMKEEVGIDVKKTIYLGNIKVVLNGMIWQGHFYDVIDYDGVVSNIEHTKHKDENWFEIIDFDNILGFAFKKGEETISDEKEILHNRKDETWYNNFILNDKYNDINVSFPFFENTYNDQRYVQYFDTEKHTYGIMEEKQFLGANN